MWKRSCAMALALLCTPAARARAWDDEVIAAARRNLPEFLEFLSIPDVADRPADIQRNAAFLEQALRKRGFTTQSLANAANRPLVLARWPSRSPNAKSVLFYIHFDGQPVIAEEWAQKDPFEPVVKQRDADGAWHEVARGRLEAQPFDPELRVFARAASDDKAPIMMMLTAFDILKEQGKAPAFEVKLILDSEEEIGSPSLGGVVAANAALFKADALVILDGPEHPSARPTLVFGNRGITQATLTV
jgi:acetylornithine deacetylase/succinyl-diaminopimelate desuccinylase-like protein